MKRLLACLFEGVHILAIALLFGAAALLTRLTSPSLMPDSLGISIEQATRLFADLVDIVGKPGRVVALAALIGGLLAPYVRNDGKLGLAWMRIILSAGVLGLLVYGWGDGGLLGIEGAGVGEVITGDVESGDAADAMVRADRTLTPWNALMMLSGLNLVLAAFQIFSARRSDD